MMSRASPTASRIAATTAMPSGMRSRAMRTFTARKPSETSARASSARCVGERSSPSEAYTGRRSAAPPSRVATGAPSTRPARSHRAASSGQ